MIPPPTARPAATAQARPEPEDGAALATDAIPSGLRENLVPDDVAKVSIADKRRSTRKRKPTVTTVQSTRKFSSRFSSKVPPEIPLIPNYYGSVD